MFQALRELALKRPLSFADLFSVRVLQAPPLRQIRQNEQEIGEIAGCNLASNFSPKKNIQDSARAVKLESYLSRCRLPEPRHGKHDLSLDFCTRVLICLYRSLILMAIQNTCFFFLFCYRKTDMHTKDGQHGGDDDGKHVLSSECRKGARKKTKFLNSKMEQHCVCELIISDRATGKLRMGNMGMGGMGMGPMACSGCGSCGGSCFGGGCGACGSCGMPNCGMVPGACGNHMGCGGCVGCGGCGHCGVGCGGGCGACGCCGGCGNFGVSAPDTPPQILAAAARAQNCGSGHCGLGCGCGNFGGVPAPVTPPHLLSVPARLQNCGMEIAHMGGCGGCCGSRCGCGWSSDGADLVMRVMEEMPSFVAQDPRGFVLRSAVPSSHALSQFGFSIHTAENCGMMMQFGHQSVITPLVGSNEF